MLLRDVKNAILGPEKLGGETGLVSTQLADPDSSQWRVDEPSFPDSSTDGSTNPKPQDVTAN